VNHLRNSDNKTKKIHVRIIFKKLYLLYYVHWFLFRIRIRSPTTGTVKGDL